MKQRIKEILIGLCVQKIMRVWVGTYNTYLIQQPISSLFPSYCSEYKQFYSSSYCLFASVDIFSVGDLQYTRTNIPEPKIYRYKLCTSLILRDNMSPSSSSTAPSWSNTTTSSNRITAIEDHNHSSSSSTTTTGMDELLAPVSTLDEPVVEEGTKKGTKFYFWIGFKITLS